MKEKLLIGTRNPGKLKRRTPHFNDFFHVSSLDACDIHTTVEESLHDLRWNAITKATTYAKLSWLLTFSEDTWFFIEALWWLPGVAVRRWWWELPNEVSDEEFLEFFIQKVSGLTDFTAYFEYVAALALPNWDHLTISEKQYWHIDIERLKNIDGHEHWYPIGKCFVHKSDGKTWYECSDSEKQKRDRQLVTKVKDVLSYYLEHWSLPVR